MRLARRLTLSLSVLTLVTLALSLSVAYLLVAREQIRDLDSALRTEAGIVAALISQDPTLVSTLNNGKSPVADPLKDLQSYAIAYDAEGKPLIWTRDSIPRPPPFSALDLQGPIPPEGYTFNYSLLNRYLRGIVISINAGPARRLFVAVSRAGFDDDMAFLLRVFASVMAIGMLSTVGIAFLVGRRVASGVQRVASVARLVAEGNLQARVVEESRWGSTEVQSLAADLNHMIAKLSELVSAHTVFASYAAHELRSPLAAMRGELQLALRRRRSVDDYELVLSSALEDVEGLIVLAEDLLTLARVQGSASQADTARVLDIVQDAADVVSGIAQIRSVALTIDPIPGTLLVPGRRPDLARVLRNILDNAVAHSPDGTQVRIAVTHTAQKVSILLSDCGPGIAYHDLPHVFQPFYRGAGEGSRNQSGAGLGLAIARGIIEAQGGTIRVDPDYRQGARFIVELPRVKDISER